MRRLTVAGLLDLLADPAAAETVVATHGPGLVIVDIADRRDLDAVAGLWPGCGLPAVIVALIHDPTLVAGAGFADIVLAGSEVDCPAALDPIVATVTANPIAATTLALLLRQPPAHDDASVFAGLVAESASFSTLQSGSEFLRWRTSHPVKQLDPAGNPVRLARHGDILDVVLSRPERRNALDRTMRDALVDALAIAIADPAVNVKLSGDGAAFCAGGDLDEFGTRPDPAIAHLTRLARSVAWSIHRVAARTSVRLHGACFGSGIELPAFAGSITATENTVIALPEVSLGLIPGAGGTVSLPRRIGRHRTAFLALSGIHLDAGTALRWGLVDSVEPT